VVVLCCVNQLIVVGVGASSIPVLLLLFRCFIVDARHPMATSTPPTSTGNACLMFTLNRLLLQVASGYGPDLVEKICNQTVKTLAGMGQLVLFESHTMPAVLVQDAWRTATVRSLARSAARAQKCCKVLLTGISGIGKTTLAKEVYYKLQKANPTMPRLFLELEAGTSPEYLRREMLRRLAFVDKVSDVPAQELPAKLAKALDGKRVLLVLDNVRQLDQLWVLEKVIDVLGPGSMVLVTGIIMAPPLWFTKAFVTLEVKYLSEESSLELLCKHVVGDSDGSTAAASDLLKRACERIDRRNGRTMLDALLARCGGLPMALEVVGLYLRATEKTRPRSQFFKDFEKTLKHVYEWTGSEGREDHRALFPALRFSWNGLEDPHKHILLDIVWCLKGQGRQLVSSHCSDAELGVLERHGFVTEGGSGVDVPAVISDFCKMDKGSQEMGRHTELHLNATQRSAKKFAAHSRPAQVIPVALGGRYQALMSPRVVAMVCLTACGPRECVLGCCITSSLLQTPSGR
jgi:hypothetical protein